MATTKKPTRFFMNITAQSLHEEKLMIPEAFVEKYGEGLPETIFLKPPNGAEWKLNLGKCDGKLCFEKGWKEFSEHHSLAHGHLLFFTYRGTSHFQLRIFGMNGLEINYPSEIVESEERASNGKGNKPANDENSKDNEAAGQKRKADLSLESLQLCKIGSGSCVNVANDMKSQEGTSSNTDHRCKGKQASTAKQATALERASSFIKSCNPSFLIFMQSSYVGGRLNLPPKFCKTYLDLGGAINLGVGNERVWTAGTLIKKTNQRTRIELSSGWRAFVKDNNLKVGDVCTFELIGRANNTFQVHIFRESELDNANCSTSRGRIDVKFYFEPIPYASNKYVRQSSAELIVKD